MKKNMSGSKKQPLRVGIGGLGTIGWPVAQWLDGEGAGGGDGLVLAAVSCAGGLMPQQMQQMVRAHGFEVINTNGTRRAVMSDQGIS